MGKCHSQTGKCHSQNAILEETNFFVGPIFGQFVLKCLFSDRPLRKFFGLWLSSVVHNFRRSRVNQILMMLISNSSFCFNISKSVIVEQKFFVEDDRFWNKTRNATWVSGLSTCYWYFAFRKWFWWAFCLIQPLRPFLRHYPLQFAVVFAFGYIRHLYRFPTETVIMTLMYSGAPWQKSTVFTTKNEYLFVKSYSCFFFWKK